MDVVLERQASFAVIGQNSDANKAMPNLLVKAKLLQASDFSELVAEVQKLQRRRVRVVSIRRQRALQIGPQRLQAVLEDAGLQVCTVGFAGGFTGTLGRNYKQAVDDTRRALEFAAQLKARAVLVVPGSRGFHTYNHAERTIRDGLYDCLDDALRLRIDMLVPLNAVFGTGKDFFVPQQKSALDWIDQLDSHRIKSMMMLRGPNPWDRLPACWERCLLNGGVLRASRRCRIQLGTHNIARHILTHLTNTAVPVC
jgi:hypothetical protein